MPLENLSGPVLAVDGLSLSRGGRNLFSALSFEVQAGQLIQLTGANGAGKTSLLRILAGLSRYGFDGKVKRLSSLLYLGHKAAVKSLLSPRENLSWHVDGLGQFSAEQIDDALAQVGLYGYEDVPSHALSAGQHRRVNLARLYLTNCPLWLLDEPFTAIDRDGVTNLEALFLEHVRAGGAVILTSHQPLSLDYAVQQLCLSKGLLS
jgi:heme exporter protein A